MACPLQSSNGLAFDRETSKYTLFSMGHGSALSQYALCWSQSSTCYSDVLSSFGVDPNWITTTCQAFWGWKFRISHAPYILWIICYSSLSRLSPVSGSFDFVKLREALKPIMQVRSGDPTHRPESGSKSYLELSHTLPLFPNHLLIPFLPDPPLSMLTALCVCSYFANQHICTPWL